MKIYRVAEQMDRLTLDMFGLNGSHPLLLLTGYASKWTTEAYPESLRSFFMELVLGLCRVESAFRPAVMTGATRYGIIQLFGETCEQLGCYPRALIGVTPLYFIEEEQVNLEEHHGYSVLTAGRRWEDAIPTMRLLRELIARDHPAVLLTVDGGLNTLKEMLAHARDGVPIYVLQGAGCFSEGFIAVREGSFYPYDLALYREILATGKVHFIELARPGEAVEELISALRLL